MLATILVLAVAIPVGRRQYRRQQAAERAQIAARAVAENQQWMTDPQAYRRRIEGTDQ